MLRGEVGGGEGFGAERPDGGYPGEASELAPEVSEIEPEEGGRATVDGGFAFACEECGVADEECGVGGGEHGRGIGRVVVEGGVSVMEVLEEDLCVGDGATAGGVGGYGADLLEGVGDGEALRILDEEEDAADFVAGGDGTAGDDGELGREGGDGDEAEVGGAGVELGGADGGLGVVDVVVRAEGGGSGLVFEVVEEWSGIQEGDGGDA